jgi:hypothetical protein
VWALPLLTAWCWTAATATRRRHKTSIAWARQRRQQVRRWLPGRRRVLVVEGGCAAVLLALAWVTPPGGMVSRVRWDAARDHPPGFQPPGKRGRQPTKGQRQRRVQGWAERADTPWEDVEVDWYGGQRLVFYIALWSREEVEAYLQERCGMEEAARRDDEPQVPPAGVCERSLACRRP